jgi:hypothetical protein
MSEYTPSTAEVRNNMALGVAVARSCADGGHPELPADITWPAGGARPAAKKQFDAWLAAYDRDLREQIAQEIEAAMPPMNTRQSGKTARLILRYAARIARGEGSE